MIFIECVVEKVEKASTKQNTILFDFVRHSICITFIDCTFFYLQWKKALSADVVVGSYFSIGSKCLSYFCNKFSHPLLTTSFTSFNFRLTLFFSCHRQKYFVVCRVSSWTRKNTIKNRISFGGLMCVQSNWFPLCSGFFVVCLLQELTKIEMFSFVCARACLWWSKRLNSFDNDTTKLSTSIQRWTLNGAPHFLYWRLFGALCEKIKQSFYSHRFASDGWQGHFVRWFCILLNEVECFLLHTKLQSNFCSIIASYRRTNEGMCCWNTNEDKMLKL